MYEGVLSMSAVAAARCKHPDSRSSIAYACWWHLELSMRATDWLLRSQSAGSHALKGVTCLISRGQHASSSPSSKPPKTFAADMINWESTVVPEFSKPVTITTGLEPKRSPSQAG